MTGPVTTTTRDEPGLRCAGCDDSIECCEACQRADCGSPICYRCLGEELDEIRPQPHEHGG